VPKTHGCRLQLDQVAFVIREEPEALETLNQARSTRGSVRAGTGDQHNARCAMRQRFHDAIVIVVS
jgi:hypothetical protein